MPVLPLIQSNYGKTVLLFFIIHIYCAFHPTKMKTYNLRYIGYYGGAAKCGSQSLLSSKSDYKASDIEKKRNRPTLHGKHVVSLQLQKPLGLFFTVLNCFSLPVLVHGFGFRHLVLGF